MTTSEPVSNQNPSQPELSGVVIHLFKGILYGESDPKLWASLLRLQAVVRDYVKVMGLELVLDEAETYAYLKSLDEVDQGEEGGSSTLPRLIARRHLSYPVSLLLALLRKRLAESDISGGATRLVLSRSEIVALMRVFLAESSNEARIVDRIDSFIGKVVDLGFVRKLKTSHPNEEATYEVKRILKAFVDAQWLAEFDARLAEYADHARGKEAEEDV